MCALLGDITLWLLSYLLSMFLPAIRWKEQQAEACKKKKKNFPGNIMYNLTIRFIYLLIKGAGI